MCPVVRDDTLFIWSRCANHNAMSRMSLYPFVYSSLPAFWRNPFSLFHLVFADVLVSAVVTDPEDPRFDLEKLIAKWESS
jgi:hypothetical protein